MTRKSGQVLLLAILIALILALTIPAVVLLNQVGSSHTVALNKSSSGIAIAREGIAYAEQILSSTATWANAITGNWNWTGDPCYTLNYTGPCNSNNIANTGFIVNNQFKLYCGAGVGCQPSLTDGTNLQSYQVAVMATALDTSNPQNPTPLRALQAYLGVRTVGAVLSDGYSASAALQMGQVPNPNPLSAGQLIVHWGSIVCYDSTQGDIWNLNSPIDNQQFPRKFSAVGIQGTTYPRCNIWSSSTTCSATTDHKEYWAFAPMSAPPAIDTTTYASLADSVTLPSNFISFFTNVSRSPTCTNPNCGHFLVTSSPGTPAVLSYNTPLSISTGVIFVAGGDVILQNMAMDFEQGAFIVYGGTITLDTNAGAPGPPQSLQYLNVPISAPLDYPYYYLGSQLNPPPCCPGGACPPTPSNCAPSVVFTNPNNTNVNFRGFLYTSGYLRMTNFATQNVWNLVGTVRVDYSLYLPGANDILYIAYDDLTNHSILVMNPQLQVEHLQEVPAF